MNRYFIYFDCKDQSDNEMNGNGVFDFDFEINSYDMLMKAEMQIQNENEVGEVMIINFIKL